MMKALAQEKRISLRNILYATDFSAQSSAALPYALSLAGKYGAKLFPVHVIALSPFPSSSLTLAWEAIASQALREARKAMAALEPEWEKIPHEVLIRKGNIWTELSQVIEEKEIDLILTATHGRTGVSKLIAGSVAENIFRHARCPVLTVGPEVSSSPKSVAETHEILYATDLSPHSLAAAPYAISLAQENQARLSLLYVIKDAEEKLSPESLTARLQELVSADAGLWCRPNTFIRHGLPEREILDLARERAADLIVLGVRAVPGIPGLSTHLPWAVAHRVVLHAHCPVLTVRG